MRRYGVLAAGCPKGKPDYQQGRKAETLKDYDAAYDFYEKALKAEPENAEYQIKFNQARFKPRVPRQTRRQSSANAAICREQWPNSSTPSPLIPPARSLSRNSARRSTMIAREESRGRCSRRTSRTRKPVTCLRAPGAQAALPRAYQPSYGQRREDRL